MLGPVLQRDLHEIEPHRQGGAAAFLVVAERAFLVETDPRGCDQVGIEADKPRVAVVAGRARLASHVAPTERLRALPGAALDHVRQHVGHHERVGSRYGARRPALERHLASRAADACIAIGEFTDGGIASLRVDDTGRRIGIRRRRVHASRAGERRLGLEHGSTRRIGDRFNEIRGDAPATVGEDRETTCHFEWGHLSGAQRKRQVGRRGLGAEAERRDVPDRRPYPGPAQQPDRNEVSRARQALAHRRRPIELPVVVLRPPLLRAAVTTALEHDGCVVDERGRRESTFERSRVDERLERRSGLSLRLYRPVVLARAEVEAAHQRNDRAVGRIEGNQRGAHGGHLREAAAPVLERLHVHDLADFHDVGSRLRSPTDCAPLQRGPGPGHRFPVEVDRRSRAHAQRGFLLANRDDHRGLEVAAGRVPAQYGGDRSCVPRQRRVDAFERAAITVAPVVFEHRPPRRHVRRRLEHAIDRRRDPVPVGQRCCTEALDEVHPDHLGNVWRLEFDDRRVDAARNRRVIRGLALGLVDLARLDHATQHVCATRVRLLDARCRVVARGRSRQAGDQRRLGQRQVPDLLVEVDLGGGADAVGSLPQEDPVQVLGQDLLLGELVLEAQGEEHLVQLATKCPLGREQRIARELHRNGAPALANAACRQVRGHRPHQPLPVHARMLEETIVFGRQEGVDEHLWDFGGRDRYAALLADLRDQQSVARVHRERQLHAQVAELRRFRQFGFQVLVGARDAECDQSTCAQGRRENGRENFPGRSLHSEIWDPVLAALGTVVHSSPRRKGKPTERWGRKATGLRDRPMTAGLPVRTIWSRSRLRGDNPHGIVA